MGTDKSPTVRRRILASELRRLRALAKLTQQQVEDAAGLSHSSLSRYESCVSSMSVPVAEKLLRIYGVDGDRLQSLLSLAKEARKRGWLSGVKGVVWEPMEELIALERDASSIQELALLVVPGRLQTERYARAVLQGGMLGTEVEQHIQARLTRATALFERDDPPEYWVILRESALHCEVGGREVMREQLRYLADFAQRPNVTIQVLPNSHGAHPSMATPFTILSFDLAPEFGVVYLDYLTGSLYRDEPAEIAQFQRAYKHLIKVALPEPQSLELITTTAEDRYP